MRLTIPTAAATRRGVLLMLLAVSLFATMDAIAKGLIANYPAPQVIWARFAGQAAILLLVLGPRRIVPALRSDFQGLHLARSAGQFGATAFFFTSLGYIGLAEATALTDISPLLITLGAALFLGEKLGARRIFGVIAAMAGAMLIIRPGLSVFTPAAMLPLCAAVCYTVNALLTRHIGAREGPVTALIHAAIFGTVVSSLALPWVWVPLAAADIPTFLLVGALGTGAQFCLIKSFSMAEASVVAPFAYVGIVLATIWGILFYQEFPDIWTLTGALVIVAAGLFVWHSETRARNGAAARQHGNAPPV